MGLSHVVRQVGYCKLTLCTCNSTKVAVREDILRQTNHVPEYYCGVVETRETRSRKTNSGGSSHSPIIVVEIATAAIPPPSCTIHLSHTKRRTKEILTALSKNIGKLSLTIYMVKSEGKLCSLRRRTYHIAQQEDLVWSARRAALSNEGHTTRTQWRRLVKSRRTSGIRVSRQQELISARETFLCILALDRIVRGG